jgi:hypothetical protein
MLDGQVRFVVSENSDFGSRGHVFVRFDGRQISLSIVTLNGVFAIAELSEFSEAVLSVFGAFWPSLAWFFAISLAALTASTAHLFKLHRFTLLNRRRRKSAERSVRLSLADDGIESRIGSAPCHYSGGPNKLSRPRSWSPTVG